MLIRDIRKQVIDEICAASTFTETQVDGALFVSSKPDVGDFVFMMQKITRDSSEPKVVSEALSRSAAIENVTLSGSALFIRIHKKQLLKSLFTEVYEERYKDDLMIGSGKNVVVEYSSPNVAKIFHAGHLRTTMLGNFLKNLYTMCGYKVVSINYLGDWGKQFGLIGYYYTEKKRNNDRKAISIFDEDIAESVSCDLKNMALDGNAAKESRRDILKYLFDIYVEVSRKAKTDPEIDKGARLFFKELEDGKKENMELWRKIRELSIAKYKEVYEKLGVHFDVYSGESQYGHSAKKLVMESDVVTTDDDGSMVIDLDELGKFIVLKSDGSTLYQTRDIAAVFDRIQKYNPEKILYVVATEQNDYFVKMKAAVEKMGAKKDLVEHVRYGLVLGMSSRMGRVVFLEDIIKDTSDAMLEVMKQSNFEGVEDMNKTALTLAISGMIVQDFGAKKAKDYTFMISRCTSIEGVTGPYLQYTHCRISSIARKNKDVHIDGVDGIDFAHVQDDAVEKLAFLLIQYPEVILECMHTHEPQVLLDFVMKVAKHVNGIFSKLRVMGCEDAEVAKARLFVYLCAQKVLRKGMEVLGLQPLDKM